MIIAHENLKFSHDVFSPRALTFTKGFSSICHQHYRRYMRLFCMYRKIQTYFRVKHLHNSINLMIPLLTTAIELFILFILCHSTSTDRPLNCRWHIYQNRSCCGFIMQTYAFTALTHWGRDNIAAILQTTFSNAFSWMKMYEPRFRFHWGLFLRFQLTIFQHWFRQWLGADQATSHYLDQCW